MANLTNTQITGNLTVTGEYEQVNIHMDGSNITAQSFNATSDLRLKENLRPFEINTNKSILDLPLYYFDYINGEKNKIGCIAQDLQKICPQIVHEDMDGFLTVEESKIIYLLLVEVKKLRKELDEFKLQC